MFLLGVILADVQLALRDERVLEGGCIRVAGGVDSHCIRLGCTNRFDSLVPIGVSRLDLGLLFCCCSLNIKGLRENSVQRLLVGTWVRLQSIECLRELG